MGDRLKVSTVKGGVETGGDVEASSTLHHHPFIRVGGGGGGARETGSRVEVEDAARATKEGHHGRAQTIPTRDQWGPFAPGIDPAEQRARLRSLRALARVYAGPRAADACRLLAQAEIDPAALEPASVALNRLAPIDLRQILGSYVRLTVSARETPMHATEIDSLWFHSNPERQFRLRRQTPAEIQQWPVPPDAAQTAWCVIRREDGALEAFGLPEGDTWEDEDEELAPFFAQLRGDKP